jgi:hypothetical protein
MPSPLAHAHHCQDPVGSPAYRRPGSPSILASTRPPAEPPPIPFFPTPPTSIKGGTQRLLLPFAPMPFLHHVLRKPSPHQPPYLSSTTDRRRTAATTGLGATVAAIATPIVSSTTWSSLPSIRLCFLLSSLSRSSRAHPRSSPATGALSPLRQHRRATAIGTSTPLSYLSEDLSP